MRPSLAWELRAKLAEIRARGKEVIVHGDRFAPLAYFAATGADRITIDPWGMVAVPGFALARSYLKGTLEKLGLGFAEFRYLKYKSAAETFSRDTMSAADREQRQRIVDVIYATVTGRRGRTAGAGRRRPWIPWWTGKALLVGPGGAGGRAGGRRRPLGRPGQVAAGEPRAPA